MKILVYPLCVEMFVPLLCVKNYEMHYRSARLQILTSIFNYIEPLTLSILVYLGLSLSLLVYLGQFWTFLVYLSLSWSIYVYFGLSRAILDYLEISRAILGYLRLSQAVLSYLLVSCVILGYIELSRARMNYHGYLLLSLAISGCNSEQQRAGYCYIKLYLYIFH